MPTRGDCTRTLIGAALIALCMLLYPLTVRSGEPEKERPVAARIRTLDGRAITLYAPLELEGRLLFPGFALERLGLTGHLILMRTTKITKCLGFTAGMREPRQVLAVIASDGAKLTGQGANGRESVPLSQIKRVALSPAPATGGFRPKHRWVVLAFNSQRLVVGWDDAEYRTPVVGKVGALSLSLSRAGVRKMTFRDGKAHVVFADGSEVEGWTPQAAGLSAQTPFGAAMLSWRLLAKAQGTLTNEAPTVRPDDWGAEDRIVLADGAEVALRGLNVARFEGVYHDARLQIDPALRGRGLDYSELRFAIEPTKLREVKKAENGRFDLTAADGTKLSGFAPTRKEFRADASGRAEVTLPWSSLDRFTRAERRAETDFKATWHLRTRLGMTLPLADLKATDATLYEPSEVRRLKDGDILKPEMGVTKVNWGAVQVVRATANGVCMRLTDGTEHMLTGTLKAACPFGKVALAIGWIMELRPVAAPQPVDPAERPADPRVVGRLTTTTGRVRDVMSAAFKGVKTAVGTEGVWGHDLLMWKCPPVQVWVSSETLLSHKLTGRGRDGRLVSSHPLLQAFGPLKEVFGKGSSRLAFTTRASESTVHLTDVGSYVPKTGTEVRGDRDEPAVRLTVAGRTAGRISFEAARVEFAHQAKYCIQGNYPLSAWPFRWHKSDSLPMVRPTGITRVPLTNLGRLEVEGDYEAKRRLALTVRGSAPLTGTVYRGKSTGVSEWDPTCEGLLCRLASKLHVFVRFADVSSIELTRLPDRTGGQK